VSNLDAFLYDLTPDLSDDPSLLEPNPFHITSDGASGRDTRRTVDGWTFVMNAADVVPANWGDGDAVLWAEGEGLTIARRRREDVRRSATRTTAYRVGVDAVARLAGAALRAPPSLPRDGQARASGSVAAPHG
jgi:hypothetical protein